ncbi:polysaccharide pyruvyl transferase family protein [Gordonia alkanivorans]|uniref:polysaccharide pyruvyl transferase family protein n=1 Tax=Gordonia alkanivorans TaxID=84096 RepID=UPI00244CCEB1|nr:polysaccharide pyruvyl transferase family protein [Gordonia alkanivorans]MDH3022472.1 polysaccharide pyruvyl transferase family protein [Gordonia alkanivorans]
MIFKVATGAYGNIGDAVIRRHVVHWFDSLPVAQSHVYIGNAPEEWIRSIAIGPEEQVYRSDAKRAWLLRLFGAPRNTILLLDPGEVPLGWRDLPAEVVMLAASALVRVKGGSVIRPPRSIGRRSPLGVIVHRCAVLLSSVVMWRDADSRRLIRRGKLVPDIAFAEPIVRGNSFESRDVLAVSFRLGRPFPNEAVFAGIAALAREYSLRIVTFSQVFDDEQRNVEVYEEFVSRGVDTEHLEWSTDELAHEASIRDIYKRALFTCSDRLHVLILASMGRSLPVEYVSAPRPKIDTVFSQVGISGVSMDANRVGESEFRNIVKRRHKTRDIEHQSITRVHGEIQFVVDNLVKELSNAV